jgi:hypothetical protein
MKITHQSVGDVIKEIFTAKPLINDDFVGFGIEGDHFNAEVIMSLFDDPPLTGDKSQRQSLQICLWFSHPDESRLNLAKLAFGEILELCYNLQNKLGWGELIPEKVDDQTVEIALYRAFDIDMGDIRLAHEHDLDSSLLRNLHRLCIEWEALSPVLSGIATGQIKQTKNIEMFLQDHWEIQMQPRN